MKISKIKNFLILLLLLQFSAISYGHEQSVSRLNLNSIEGKGTVSWTVAIADVLRVVALDDNQDGNIQWREITKNREKLSLLLKQNVLLNTSGENCSIIFGDVKTEQAISTVNLLLSGNFTCNKPLRSISYKFLENLDSLHIGYLQYHTGQENFSHVFSGANRKTSFNHPATSTFFGFVYQGTKHILMGLDHLAFLLILFFSAKALKNNKSFARKMLHYISAFTVAHSITLITASLNLIQLPSWFVETIIAASVAWGAIVIIAGRFEVKTSTVFGFGLIHGLGFATVLQELTGDISSNVLLLLGFNLGVEIGQLLFLVAVFVLIFLPIKLLGQVKIARIVATPILLLSSIWIVERLFSIEITGL